jgi:hypothetical protein
MEVPGSNLEGKSVFTTHDVFSWFNGYVSICLVVSENLRHTIKGHCKNNASALSVRFGHKR